jgi:hypothetical protein
VRQEKDHGVEESEVRKLHHALDFIGMRAQATAVGVVQLSIELRRANIIDEAALGRIKDAIAQDIALGRPRSSERDAFQAELRGRLDRVFAGELPVGELPLNQA